MFSQRTVRESLGLLDGRCREIVLAIALAAWVPALAAGAETKAAREQEAKSLVRSVLKSELDGQGDRSQLLNAALQKSPDNPSARWLSGQIYWNKHWLPYEQVSQLPDYQAALAAYHKQRDAAPATVQGQMQLADWCSKQGLAEQRQAHLAKALELDPDNPLVRSQLGYVRVGDRWLSQRDLTTARQRDLQSRQAFARWKPTLDSIQAGFSSGLAANRTQARERLAVIDDPQAIPAMELLVSSRGDEQARAVVERLAVMRGPEASIGLARHAVFTPWYSVGERAAKKLKSRSEHDYIPSLLAALQSPAKSTRTVFYDGSSVLLQRYSFSREGQDRNQKLIVDSSYGIWVIAPDGQGWLPPLVDNLGAQDREMAELASRELQGRAEVEAFAMRTALEQQNETTKALNERICRVLAAVSGQTLPADPPAWWSWWNDRNEVYFEGQKPTDTVYVSRTTTTELTVGRNDDVARYECLAAGTEVWTDSGPRAIEKIQTGDRVLAQHSQTGELAYRTVLRPTQRKPERLMTIKLPSQTIRSTGGHPFWVVGKGWAMARELEPGMRLHSPAGAVEIVATGTADAEPTFNLIVDDFHNYFVGPDRVLSHDNTVREPTLGGLPGISE